MEPTIRVGSPDKGIRHEYDSAESFFVGREASTSPEANDSAQFVADSESAVEQEPGQNSIKREDGKSEEDVLEVENDDEMEELGSLDIEYLRFENTIYHLKRAELNRTFCGLEIGDRVHKTSEQKPQLLEPCKPCHGETSVKTVEEQRQELRERISERIADVTPSQVNPGKFSTEELVALCKALPAELPHEVPSDSSIRSTLSRAIKDIEPAETSPNEFTRDELEALVDALSGTGIVSAEPCVIIRAENGRVKRVPIEEFQKQKRGGKGITISDRDANIADLTVGFPRDRLLVFTDLGQVYQMDAHEIPSRPRKEQGNLFTEILHLDQGEQVCSILPITRLEEYEYIITVTKEGFIKRTPTEKFANILSTGIVAVDIEKSDELVGATVTGGGQDIIIETHAGQAIRFPEDEVRPMGRTARGVQGINLKPDDEAVGMAVIDHGESASGHVLTATRNGYGKRTEVGDYKPQSRNGLGLVDIITNERNGAVVGVEHVGKEEQIIFASEGGKAIQVRIDDISVVGRNTKGILLMDLDEEDEVVACSPLPTDHS